MPRVTSGITEIAGMNTGTNTEMVSVAIRAMIISEGNIVEVVAQSPSKDLKISRCFPPAALMPVHGYFGADHAHTSNSNTRPGPS